MKRALVFLLVGPGLVATIAPLATLQIVGPPARDVLQIFAIILFLFTLPVAALSGSLDAYLARALATPLRALLIAAVGAVVSSGLAYILFSPFLPPAFDLLAFFAICGAVSMGLCSLLAGEYGWKESSVQANSLLRN
jgi:hypothetical protein